MKKIVVKKIPVSGVTEVQKSPELPPPQKSKSIFQRIVDIVIKDIRVKFGRSKPRITEDQIKHGIESTMKRMALK